LSDGPTGWLHHQGGIEGSTDIDTAFFLARYPRVTMSPASEFTYAIFGIEVFKQPAARVFLLRLLPSLERLLATSNLSML